MNRPIKFRAWDDRNKRFGYMTIQANMIAWPSNLWMSQVSHDDEGVRFDDVTDWQQFTGLHDKNGREIYEGDILIPRDMHDCNIDSWTHKAPTGKDPYSCIGVLMQVKWIEHMCGFDVPPNTQYWEVIGNIHENPELLNPEKGVGK